MNSSKKSVVILLISGLLLLSGLFYLKTKPYTKPNVVFVMVDSLRADAISAINPNAKYKTPGFDKMAQLGALFTNARSQGPATFPSTYSFLSSKYPSEIISQWRWSSLNKGDDSSDPPQDSKKQSFLDMVKSNGYKIDFMTQGFRPDRLGFTIDATVYDEHPEHAIPMSIADEILKYVAAPHKEPFFLFSVIFDPHAPWDHGDCVQCEDDEAERYYTEVQLADNAIEKLATKLDKAGFFRNNILVLVSDHGVNLGEHKVSFDEDKKTAVPHGLKHGYSVYDELIRVPLIIISPETYRKGYIIPEFVEIRSLAKTFSTLLDMPMLRGLSDETDDLTKYFSMKNTPKPKPVISEGVLSLVRDFDSRYNARLLSESKSIILDGFKLIFNTGNNSFELYDLNNDPKESKNIIDGYSEKSLSMYNLMKDQLDLSANYHLPKIIDNTVFPYLNEKLKFSPDLSDGLDKASGKELLLAIVKPEAKQRFLIGTEGEFELRIKAREVFGKERRIEFFLDNERIGTINLSNGIRKELKFGPIFLAKGNHYLSIKPDGFLVPDALVHNGDLRKIYGFIEGIELVRHDNQTRNDAESVDMPINIIQIYTSSFEEELNILNLIDKDMSTFWPLSQDNQFNQITFTLDRGDERNVQRILLYFGDRSITEELKYSPRFSDGLAQIPGERLLLEIVKDGAKQLFKVGKAGRFVLQVKAKEVFGKDRNLVFYLDNKKIGSVKLSNGVLESFKSEPLPLATGDHLLSITADGHVVPDKIVKNHDLRKIYGLIEDLELVRQGPANASKEPEKTTRDYYSNFDEDHLMLLGSQNGIVWEPVPARIKIGTGDVMSIVLSQASNFRHFRLNFASDSSPVRLSEVMVY